MVRLINISANTGDLLQDLSYSYDAVGNITKIEQSAGPVNGLGGEYHNYFIYDNLNRLNKAYCQQPGVFDYDFSITMSPTGRIGEKNLTYAAGAISSYQLNGYDKNFTTHQPRVIYDQVRGSQSLFWDANGNLSQTVDCKTGSASINFWDEENRLRLAVNPKFAGYYGYDANGERVYKLTGRTQYDDLNGSNPSFGIIFDGLTVYPSPYIVLTKKQYTKHYYAGTDKIATMIGDGGLLLEQSHLTNEQRSLIKDGFCRTFEPTTFQYEKTMNMDIEGRHQDQLEDVCGYIDQVNLSINSFTPMLEPMMQIWQNSNGCKNEIYYTHGDHLGSANWITDVKGNPIQYIHYAPYGEQIANQQTIGYDERFKFTGKERDAETGYDYFGARFYDHRKGIWNSVDPLADKNISNSPYMYCSGNPIMLVDPDGRDEWNFDECTNTFRKVGEKGGSEKDYYHFGSYDDNGNFTSNKDYTINRNKKSMINSFRIIESENSTISVFHIPDAQEGELSFGYFLERPGPDTSQSGKLKRIPEGNYGFVKHNGAKYSNVPRLYKLDEGLDCGIYLRAILIHPGNIPAHTEGCLLPGSIVGKDCVGNSKNTFNRLMTIINNRGWGEMHLTIINAFKK